MLPHHHLKLVLVEPEIPQNAGNIARLCAVTNASLHLVRPLGFFLTEKHFKRAGMDYLDRTTITVHDSLDALWPHLGADPFWLTSGLGGQPSWQTPFTSRDWIFLGKETAGLPKPLLAAHEDRRVMIPMTHGSRGINVSTAAGIVLYEALRQVSRST